MNEQYLYTLLIVIKNNGDAVRLIREGLTYKQIADLSNSAIKEAYIVFNEKDELIITEKGSLKILELELKFKKTDKTKWIEKERVSQIVKLEKDFIFLPNQNEIHF